MNKAAHIHSPELLGSDEQEEDIADLRDYLAIALQSWKLIVTIVLLAALAGAFMAWALPPVYKTNALIQVEPRDQNPLGLSQNPLSGLTSQLGSSAEIEIIRSRAIIEQAVAELDLDILAKPHYLGPFGAALARHHDPDAGLAKPPLPFLDQYAWGGETLGIAHLQVPRNLKGQPLTLIAGTHGDYRLNDQNGATLLEGQAGETAKHELSPDNTVEMRVDELTARPGTEFNITKLSQHKAIARILKRLSVVERGKQTGVLALTLEGASPQGVEQRLNAIATSYLKQNVERQSEEARKQLDFVSDQLPKQRAKVDSAQASLREYQSTNGTVDLSLEAEDMLDKLADIESQLTELKLKHTELTRLYTEDHPVVQSLERKRAQLREKRNKINQRLKKLPGVESQHLTLSRDAKVASELYKVLLNKSQELKVVEAGVTGYVRIIDRPFLPNQAAGPNRPLIVVIATVLGLILALGLVLLRRALRRALDTPEAIERELGLPVYATVPHSKTQLTCHPKPHGKATPAQTVLARRAGDDNAVESLRSLRTSLQFALMETQNNVVSITSPTPELGKSFVSINLAFLLADVGKRVLLIDADMRRGHLHQYLGLARNPGLSDVIAGRCQLDAALHAIEGDTLSFLATGTIPPNPSELLVSDAFTRLLTGIRERFDLILFDTPPILNITDGIIAARQAGTNFLVVRANKSSLHEVELSIKRLQQNHIKLTGAIFNGLKLGPTSYGYTKYGYQAYQYKSAKA